MANHIDSLKKLKSDKWTEIRTRSQQAFSGYAERIGLGAKVPTDEEFASLIEHEALGERPTRENLVAFFSQSARNSFFISLWNLDSTAERYRLEFPDEAERCVKEADRIVDGRFDLMGYKDLKFGLPVDWHFEPVSGKRSPLRHWKQFDELATDETGDKKIVWELNRHQYFTTLGIAYRLTKDEVYAETFVSHLKSWIEANPPGMGINWMSSLEVAMRAISWLWAFRFFEGSKSFTPKVFFKASKFLLLHGKHLEKYLSTYYSPNTHLTGEALGLFYLGTQLSFLKCAKDWRKLGKQILLAELDRQILDDGVYFEQSTWYQRYTVDFYSQFILLAEICKEEIDSESRMKLKSKLTAMLDFLMQITRPDGTTPLIGDDDGGKALRLSNAPPNDFRALLSTGAVMFKRGDYKFVAQNFYADTFWLLGENSKGTFDSIEARRPEKTSCAFESGGYYVMRDGWQDTDNFLIVDCGQLGALSGGHSHADALSIDVAAFGRTLIIDPGTYTYHESRALRDHFRSTKAHNTLTVNEKSSSEMSGKFSWKRKVNPKVNSWISDERFDFFEGQHDGFSEMLKPCAHVRSILSLKNNYWVIRDQVETGARNEYQINFQFGPGSSPATRVAAGGKEFIEEPDASGVGFRMFTFGDGGKWKIAEGEISSCYGSKESAPLARYVSKGIGVQEYFTFLIPTDKYCVNPEVIETPIVGGRAFVIRFADYSDVFVYSDGQESIHTEFFDADFRFVWARILPSEELPEEFVLVDGKTLSVGGREIIKGNSQLEFLSARRLGQKLNARTNEGVFSTTISQNRPAAYVIKNSETK